MKKRTVSIKRTVWEIFLMTLLNVPYDPKIKTIIALSYRTYNRVFRVLSLISFVEKFSKKSEFLPFMLYKTITLLWDNELLFHEKTSIVLMGGN